MIKFLYNYGSVVVFDYRSFGKSESGGGMLTSDNLITDAVSVWRYTTNILQYTPNNISLFGESLGCAVAIKLTADLSLTMNMTNYPHSLILNSPFYSLGSMIKSTFKKINIGFMGQILAPIFGREYENHKLIKLINHETKIIIAHSPRDEVVPYQEGLQLYQSISEIHPNAKFIQISGTHNNLGLTDTYIYALADLLA